MRRQTTIGQNSFRSIERTLWIISEGSPGHISQSRGLVDALCSLTSLRFQQIEVRQRGAGGLRWIFRALFQLVPQLRPFWVKLCTSGGVLPADSPDFLVASGGKSVFFARYLADRFNIPLVFCGKPAPYPVSWFDCILSTEPSSNGAGNWIHTDVLLNPINSATVKTAATEFPLDCRRAGAKTKIGAVLVGGRSRSQLFTDDDWRALGKQLNVLSERGGWRWLISTSRRTGSNAEAILATILDPNYILDAVWWSKNQRKVVRSFLGHAEVVFVGRDSMTMISEAVCSGRSVVVFSSKKTIPSQLIDGFVENLEEKRLILCKSCHELELVTDLYSDLNLLLESPVQTYAQRILEILDS